MGALRLLWQVMRSVVRAATGVTASGLLALPEAWAVLLLPSTEMPTVARVVRGEACSLASRGVVVREVLLKLRLEPLPAGLAGLAAST